MKGSLKTFLNAMTYPDRTVYPVASQNLQDFYNLVDVYLDAVFHPRITPDILKQEGWHYELEDAAGPLTYKGVVFNEMKGAYSSPDDRVYRISQQSAYPDNTYGVSSGGDPAQHPRPDLRPVQVVSRPLLSPVQRPPVLLRRRRPRAPPRTARRLPERILADRASTSTVALAAALQLRPASSRRRSHAERPGAGQAGAHHRQLDARRIHRQRRQASP